MRGSFRLTRIFGINIDIHFTFFLLLLIFFILLGPRGLILILGVFFFVTIHELSHSLVAIHYGVKVKRITLLPIGGVASMSEIPSKPAQELLISVAGPLSNVLVAIIFYFPLKLLLGQEALMYPFLVITGQAPFSGNFNVLAHIYWINLILAVFNMLPAFPMDGGRVLRAILSYRMSYREATGVAVRLGHIFALLFGYIGLVHGHIFLLIIAVFIYMAASSEGIQVDVQETIKKFAVRDVLARKFVHISPDATLANLLELMFHTHQEDFPVLEDGRLKGFVTRRAVIQGVHVKGKDVKVSEIMRKDIPTVKPETRLHEVQKLMQKYQTHAMPVEKHGHIVGIVTLDDINRVYMVVGEH
ncbi:MAG: site-2 protease family protein [Candidatus Omnitrophota bacterium]|jgi:Zn-dependent protease/CBS domain-containing protein